MRIVGVQDVCLGEPEEPSGPGVPARRICNRAAGADVPAELLKFGIIFVLLTHYLACLWAFVGLNWEPTEGVSGEDEKSWIDAYGMLHYPLHRLYGVAFYVSIVAIFGGVSSVAPQNFLEYVSLTCMMFVGGLTWAYVLSMLCAIFSKLDPLFDAYGWAHDEHAWTEAVSIGAVR